MPTIMWRLPQQVVIVAKLLGGNIAVGGRGEGGWQSACGKLGGDACVSCVAADA
jgi:hypothetical protein